MADPQDFWPWDKKPDWWDYTFFLTLVALSAYLVMIQANPL